MNIFNYFLMDIRSYSDNSVIFHILIIGTIIDNY